MFTYICDHICMYAHMYSYLNMFVYPYLLYSHILDTQKDTCIYVCSYIYIFKSSFFKIIVTYIFSKLVYTYFVSMKHKNEKAYSTCKLLLETWQPFHPSLLLPRIYQYFQRPNEILCQRISVILESNIIAVLLENLLTYL